MDPLTASLLFQGAGALIKGLGSSSAAKKREDLLRGLSDEGEAEIPGLEKKVDQYDIGPTMRKLRQMAAEDPIGDLARQELQRSKGTAIEALKSGGAKSLFALPATMAGIDRSRRQIDADSFGRTQSALSKVGQAEELVGRAKFGQDVSDLRSARSQALGFKLDAERAEQQGRDARLGMLTSGLSALGSLAGAGAFGDGTGGGAPKSGFIKSGTEMDSAIMPTEIPAYVKAAQKAASAGSMTITPESQLTPSLNRREVVLESDPFAVQAPAVMRSVQPSVSGLTTFSPGQGLYGPGSLDGYSGSLSGITQYPTGAPYRQRTPPMVGALPLPDYQAPPALDITGSYDIRNLLDILGSSALNGISFARGGRTKGAFNHDTNDMKIVDKNGKPTGMSVTGDEMVITPEQQEAIAKQSSYFRSLIKTPNFR